MSITAVVNTPIAIPFTLLDSLGADLDVLPTHAVDDELNAGLRHSESRGKFLPWHSALVFGANQQNVGFRELSRPVALAWRRSVLLPPLAAFVIGIVAICPNKEVRRVAARRVVARMEAMQLARITTVQNQCEPMRAHIELSPVGSARGEEPVTVPVAIAHPWPTSVRAAASINELPKSLVRGDNLAGVGLAGASEASRVARLGNLSSTVNAKLVRLVVHRGLPPAVSRPGRLERGAGLFCCPIIPKGVAA